MLHRQMESNPRNRFLVSLNVYKYGLWYNNPIPTWFVAPIDCSEIPAQVLLVQAFQYSLYEKFNYLQIML